jgi:hypothetical protein
MKKFIAFFACLLHSDCIYSSKKILMYIFSGLILYLAIFTDKQYIELLTFVAVLAGVRTYEGIQTMKINKG